MNGETVPHRSPDVATLNQMAQTWFAHLADREAHGRVMFANRERIARTLGMEPYDYENTADIEYEMADLRHLATIDLQDQRELDERDQRALRTGRRMVRLTLDSAYEEHEFREITERDPMTGLLSATGRDHHLERVIGRNWRQDNLSAQGAYVGACDLANFKRINDVLSHAVGDECIKEAAEELERTVRPDDLPILARPSGDEFDVILGRISAEDLAHYQDRMREAQYAKVADGRYVETWDRIFAIREAAEASKSPYVPEVRVEYDENSEGVRVLYINDERIVPLRDITVNAIGFNTESIWYIDDFKAHNLAAEASLKTEKRRLHELMGGTDRPSDTPTAE